ncbi:MAG: ABC transporter permease [Dehalococcoidia bacterium]
MAVTDISILEQYALRARPSFGHRVWTSVSSFVRHKPIGAFGAVFVFVLLAMAAVPEAFVLGRHDPTIGVLGDRLNGPSWENWFGVDQQGRDLYTRIIYGARTSIIIGFGVVAIGAVIAVVIGVTSGYFGGWVDMLGQRLVDIGIALPGLIFIILFVTSLQQIPLMFRIVLSLGLLVSLGSSRILRGATIAAKQNQYVEACRVIGATDLRIIARHIFPNVFPILLISASIQIGGAVLVESSLAFLGYGVTPPTASWGRMLNEAREQLVRSPHMAIFPGLAIFFTVYSFNMFGDALRDVLDPRLRGSR